MLMYLASISPNPERSSFMGAWHRISPSPTMVSAQRLGREIFSPDRFMEEVAEA